MTATAPRYSRWDLDTLRAGKAVRDAEGVVIECLDAALAVAEAQHAARRPASPLGDTHNVPLRDRHPAESAAAYRASDGRRTGTTEDGATDKQLALIARLCDDLGRAADDRPEPRSKREASGIIDGLMKQVAHARRTGATPARVERKATERQAEFLASLLNERAHNLGDLDPAEVTAARASALIELLLSAPRAKVAAHGIREGRYAYEIAPGEARFYRVARTGGIRVQAGPAEHPYNGKLNADLEWIKANPREAAELYGRLIGKCGRCGLPLTDDDSRERGVGPVCATKTEW